MTERYPNNKKERSSSELRKMVRATDHCLREGNMTTLELFTRAYARYEPGTPPAELEKALGTYDLGREEIFAGHRVEDAFIPQPVERFVRDVRVAATQALSADKAGKPPYVRYPRRAYA
ncbi:MAG: hypothetical protein B7X04_00205 [Parcubacteria group bacterium 21-54-25]|nr:MAG: hypothetical protein B7X04_00205 [Parcubacteria group bacterium 21-54-25]HQU07520.1 hypothetical protein [Candidatus Paceibacterota bacterium]